MRPLLSLMLILAVGCESFGLKKDRHELERGRAASAVGLALSTDDAAQSQPRLPINPDLGDEFDLDGPLDPDDDDYNGPFRSLPDAGAADPPVCTPDGCPAGCCDCGDRLDDIDKKLDEISDLMLRVVMSLHSSENPSTPAGRRPNDTATPSAPAGDLGTGASAASAIQWVSLAEAQASGKPIWIHFTAPGCAPCKRFDDVNAVDPQVIAKSRAWACVRSNDDAAMRERYYVRDVPYEIFEVPNSPQRRFKGRSSPAMLAEFLTLGGDR